LASGLNQLGSSRLAAFTPIHSGPAELDANNGVPQMEQKARLEMLPLSASFSKCAGCPFVNFRALIAITNVGEKALPLAIWQSRQWQLSIRSGNAKHS
jgi:hypothetical protein